jgi:hypothetical protein
MEELNMATKKASSKASSKAGKSSAKVTADKVTVTLSGADRAKAMKCIRETGKISLSAREVEVTKLSDLNNAIIVIN